jgi:hypothetical protein
MRTKKTHWLENDKWKYHLRRILIFKILDMSKKGENNLL